eukprot:13267243-Heterocapsa_arctica.AAC.1
MVVHEIHSNRGRDVRSTRTLPEDSEHESSTSATAIDADKARMEPWHQVERGEACLLSMGSEQRGH